MPPALRKRASATIPSHLTGQGRLIWTMHKPAIQIMICLGEGINGKGIV